MDTFTPAQRSERMAQIPSKNTKPELAVRSFVLDRLSFQGSSHKDLADASAFVFSSLKQSSFTVLLSYARRMQLFEQAKTRAFYWSETIARNKHRDLRNASARAGSVGAWQALSNAKLSLTISSVRRFCDFLVQRKYVNEQR